MRRLHAATRAASCMRPVGRVSGLGRTDTRLNYSLLYRPCAVLSRSFSAAPAPPAAPDFKMIAHAVVERLPRVAPERPDWCKNYTELKQKIQAELAIVPTVEGEKEEVVEEDDSFGANEEKDKDSQFWQLPPAPVWTKADEENNTKSLQRRLTTFLFLIINDGKQWRFPQAEWDGSEEIRTTTERALTTEGAADLKVYWVGHCPVGHVEYPGTRSFFYRCQHLRGKMDLSKTDVKDFAWVTKEELKDYIAPEVYEVAKDML